MKLAIVTKRTLAHGFGGVETNVHTLAKLAARRGDHATMLATAHPAGRTSEDVDGTRVLYMPGAPSVYSRAFWDATVATVRDLRARGELDLVLSMNLAGYGIATSGLGVPHYAFSTGRTIAHLASEWHEWRGLAGLLAYPKHAAALAYYAWLERRLYARLDGVIAEDEALFHELRRRGVRAMLVYGGVNAAQFPRDPALRAKTRERLAIPPGADVLLMMATVNRQKGVWVGVEAFVTLAPARPALHLVVVGDGPERARLERRVSSAGIGSRARFVGAVPAADACAFHNAADVLLYPTFRVEGLPAAIVEALSVGVPVIAADRGGVSTAVRDGETGLLLPRADVDAFVAAIARLLDDPAGRRAMGDRGRAAVAERFDMQRLVPALLDDLTQRHALPAGGATERAR